SIYEGFPNVFPEALYFGNYIITTKLSAVYDITDNERIGKIVPIGNVKKLSIILQGIFEGDLPLESLYPKILKHSEIFSWNNTITPIVVRIKKKLCE
ncbi:glycosyltransferase, partial [Bacteroides fragilis]